MRGKYAVIGSLYLTQGLPFGLAMIAMPAILRQAGHPVESLGIFALVMLPWAFKLLWGPLVDNHGLARFGHRRSWIVPLQVATAAGFAALAHLPPESTPIVGFAAALVLINLLCATQDIATDGYAVEQLAREQHAFGNSLQIGGFCLGMLLGGSGVLIVVEHLGWAAAMMGLGIVTGLLTLPVLLRSEGVATPPPGGEKAATKRASLRALLRRPGIWVLLAVAGLFKAGSAGGEALLHPYLVDAGYGLDEVGMISGTALIGLGTVFAFLGGAVTTRLGAERTLVTFVALSALGMGALAILAAIGQTDLAQLLPALLLENISINIAYVAAFVLFMRWSSKEQAGTDFTAFQCVEAIGNIAAIGVATHLAGQLGYGAAFAFTALAGLAVALFLRTVLTEPAARRLDTIPEASATGE
ncbi:MAG: MFS transporter [Burkholderiaceae bacterium]|jgi:RhtX/FptX family siderophore transporter|nr:MFS transporter [Burkholderiaceae bacterium]